jgi:hypothetical protein
VSPRQFTNETACATYAMVLLGSSAICRSRTRTASPYWRRKSCRFAISAGPSGEPRIERHRAREARERVVVASERQLGRAERVEQLGAVRVRAEGDRRSRSMASHCPSDSSPSARLASGSVESRANARSAAERARASRAGVGSSRDTYRRQCACASRAHADANAGSSATARS